MIFLKNNILINLQVCINNNMCTSLRRIYAHHCFNIKYNNLILLHTYVEYQNVMNLIKLKLKLVNLITHNTFLICCELGL